MTNTFEEMRDREPARSSPVCDGSHSEIRHAPHPWKILHPRRRVLRNRRSACIRGISVAAADRGPGTGSRVYRLIGETSTLVAVINAALAGVVVALVANAAGTGSELSLFIGGVITTVLVVSLVNTSRRLIERGRRLLEPRVARQVETVRRHG